MSELPVLFLVMQQGRSSPVDRVSPSSESYAIPPSCLWPPSGRPFIICHDEGCFELYQFRPHERTEQWHECGARARDDVFRSSAASSRGEAKLLASFCPSVRSSFALGEFRAANLFVPSLSLLSTYSLSSDPIRCNDAAADPFQ